DGYHHAASRWRDVLAEVPPLRARALVVAQEVIEANRFTGVREERELLLVDRVDVADALGGFHERERELAESRLDRGERLITGYVGAVNHRLHGRRTGIRGSRGTRPVARPRV